MKQHITVKQLNELTNQGQYELCNKNNIIYWNGMSRSEITKNITISKMIEILRKCIVMIEFLDHSDDDYNYVVQILINKGFEEEYINFENFELCDALWDAVKSVL